MISLGQKLQQLAKLRGTSDISIWIEGFLNKVWRITDEGRDTTVLTGKQAEVIENEWRRHFGS